MNSDEILIWPEVTSTKDLSIHFWSATGNEHPIRICDGEGRPETQVPSDGPSFACSACRDVYVGDILHGGHRFQLLDRPPEELRRTPVNIMYTHAHGRGIHDDNMGIHAKIMGDAIQSGESDQMTVPVTTLASFAEFYDTIRSRRIAMLRNLRDRHFNPSAYHHRDYYLQIRNCIKFAHWRSDRLQVFIDALDGLNFQPGQAKKRQAAHDVAEHYISHWKRQGVSVFDVPPDVVGFEDLQLRLAPDIGVENSHGDLLVTRLWFNYKKPTVAYRQAFHWLYDNLRPNGWDEEWQPVIWDVRRETFLGPPAVMPRDIELNLRGDAAAFRAMWDLLSVQQEQDEDTGS